MNAKTYIRDYNDILCRMIAEMTGDSISGSFIIRMIPHHRAAIEMSENVLKYTDLSELREIAENIISEQTESIEQMEHILPVCAEKKNSRSDFLDYRRNEEIIIRRMFSEMKNAYADCRVDCDFMREMIPHHMGAVKMSENALSFPICEKLVPVLKAIISSQEKGIHRMRELMETAECIKKG